MSVFCNSCRVFLKISRACRHLHEKLASTLIVLIATSNSKLYDTSILGQWKYYAYVSDLSLMLTQKHLLPFSNNLGACHH